MKSCLNFEKTASSALIFATLGCLAANFSPAQAAPDINPAKAAALLESSAEEFPVSTDLPTQTETARTAPVATHPTEVAVVNQITESAIPAPNEDTPVDTTEVSANELAVAPPAHSLTPPKISRTDLETAASSTEASDETSVEDLTNNELAVAAPANSLTPPKISRTELETASGSTEALDETRVEDLMKPEQLEAQALPAEVDASETEPPAAIPLDPLESVEVDDSMDQVTNVSQLSDVQPSDWAYEALRSLVERYGCIAGYPDRTFRGNRALTRYEFAAGLNACLQQIERLIAGIGTDLVSRSDLESLQRLVSEFQTELTSLGTRVDTLEGRVADLEENQFSTTTKLFGQAIFGLQGRTENEFDLFLDRVEDEATNINVIHNVQLSLFTQFGPRSLLLTGLQAGDGSTIAPGLPSLETYVGLSFEGDTDNSVELSDLNYRQLIGSNFAVIFGPVGVNPVNVFRGSNRVESAGFGPISRFAQRNPIINIGGGGGGIGFDWQIATPVSLQAVYSTNRSNDPANGGIFGGEEGTTTAGAQLVVSPTDDIDLTFQYINSYSPSGFLFTGVGDDLLVLPDINPEGFQRGPIQTNAFGASIEWRVTSGFSVGGWGGYTTSDFKGGSGSVDTLNWMAFLNFPDLFGEGNLAGIFIGQPPRITSSDVSADGAGRNVPSFINRADPNAGEGGQPDTTLHLEAFYRFRLTDNISLTPGVIVILNPNHNDNNDNITIGALRTTFTF